MSRSQNPKLLAMRQRIAACAARIMAEDGIDDFALAKRKALRQLGADSTQAMPNNEEIERELSAYRDIYQRDEHVARTRELRRTALHAMRLLAKFRPYLAGPVFKGTAGRYAEIDLLLFADSDKDVEIFLLNQGLEFEPGVGHYYAGDQERLVSVLSVEIEHLTVRVAIFPVVDQRHVLRHTGMGRPIERGNLDAVVALLDEPAS